MNDTDHHRSRGWLAAPAGAAGWSSDADDSFPSKLLGDVTAFLDVDRPRQNESIDFIIPNVIHTCNANASHTALHIAMFAVFRYPVTLTFIQFAFVSSYCALFMSPIVRFSKMRRPSRAILETTLPMGAFQVGGHIFSSMAISRIPVSTVHTIKALSPLFTVAAYALLFKVSYSAQTYISLLPLTIGVMLVCTFDVSGSNLTGLLCAFGSALVFVTSNIFFKKVMPSGANQTSSHKLDKLNLLFYSSGMAFVLMIPIWLYCDLPLLLAANNEPEHVVHPGKGHDAAHSVTYYLFMNGTVHFAQNIIAFIILASVSPVTYSIASLIKRVVVICIAIVWFAQSVHPVQGVGIGMTFFGLYMYNQAKGDVEKGESKMRRVEAARDMRLPLTMEPADKLDVPAEPLSTQNISVTSAHERSRANPSPTGQRAFIPADLLTEKEPISYSQTHPHPNLHIKIHPPSLPVSPNGSTLDSYPSPPASVDSPPISAVSLVNQGVPNSWISKRGPGNTDVLGDVRVGVVA